MNSDRLVITFAMIGHAMVHVLIALFLTLVIALEAEWGLAYEQLIALWTIGALLLGVGAPLAGIASDRWGEAPVMIVYFVGTGLAAIGCGLASGPIGLQVGLGLLGLFAAIYHPVGTAWVVKHAHRRGRTIAIVGIAGGVGAALASLIAGGLADLISWRAAFAIPGAVSVALGLALWVARATGRIVDRDGDRVPQPQASRSDVRQAFIVLAFTMALSSLAYFAFTTVLPKWVEFSVGSALGDGLLGLGALISAIYLFGAAAQLVGGSLADRGAARLAYIASYGAKAALLGTAALVGGWPVVLIATGVIFTFDVAAPVENVLMARFMPTGRRGLAYGLRNGIAIGMGPLAVELVAWLYDAETGFTALLLVLSAAMLAVFLAALWLPSDKAAPVREPA